MTDFFQQKAILGAVLALAHCGPDVLQIDVTVHTQGIDGIESLALTSSLDERPSIGPPGQIRAPVDRFIIKLPPATGREQVLAWDVRALDKASCQVGLGSGGPQRVGDLVGKPLDILLEQYSEGCLIEVTRVGQLAGTITVTQQPATDGPGQTDSLSSVCSFSNVESTYSCPVRPPGPAGSIVTLHFEPEAGTHPASVVTNWSGCNPQGADCQTVLGSTRVSVQLALSESNVCSRDGWCRDLALPDSSYLSGIWGSSPQSVWVVGARGIILYWDGKSWSWQPSGIVSDLSRVWGSGSGDVWAIGQYANVLHSSGVWIPQNAGVASYLSSISGIWGSGPSDVWIVGAGTSLHWDGSRWDPLVAGGLSTNLYGVWGSRSDDVWAVGLSGVTLHWKGSSWISEKSGTGAYLLGIWGSASNDVWAVGEGGTILHWDGSQWTPRNSGTKVDLTGVWGSGVNDVWISGKKGTILHWDGTRWTPSLSGITSNLSGIWGTGPTDVWACGANGILRHR